MGVDPLYRPLGVDAPEPPSPRRPVRALIGALAVLVAVGGAWSAVRAFRHHGGPEAVASIEVTPPHPPEPPAAAPGSARVVEVAPDPVPGTTVEVQNGVKVVRFNPAATGPLRVGVEDAARVPLRPAPDPRVSEASRWGVLPRLGPKGLRPLDIYASPNPAAGRPAVALLLDGMGADQMATADAARRLAAPVSFAFPSTAPDASAQVAESRRAGHEVFMGVTDGGSPDALRGQMGQFPGYVGLLGGDWLASPDLAGDVTGRGLLLVPGDASPSGPSQPVDLLRVDASGGAPALQAALDRLLVVARQKGAASVLVLHGALATAQVAEFTGRLAAEGVTLVPASALLSSPEPAGKPPATVRAQ